MRETGGKILGMKIYDLDLKEITDLLEEWNEPAFRAKQIWQGLYQHFYSSPEQFTNLPKSLREKLSSSHCVRSSIHTSCSTA